MKIIQDNTFHNLIDFKDLNTGDIFTFVSGGEASRFTYMRTCSNFDGPKDCYINLNDGNMYSYYDIFGKDRIHPKVIKLKAEPLRVSFN